MKQGTDINRDCFKLPVLITLLYLESIGINPWGGYDMLRVTTEAAPMRDNDMSEFVEGKDYRILTKEQVIKELSEGKDL